jgi:hypothetical protein
MKKKPEIRPEFREYMHSLGFTDEQIDAAYLRAYKNHNSSDSFVTEVICRDILQGKDDYLEDKIN